MFDLTLEDVELAPIIPASPGNCTVVSIVPYAIKEVKPQIIPGYFQIPPAREGQIQCLPIGESIHWMESPYKGTPPIKLTETSKAIAKSIVNDFIEAQLAVDSDAAPGLFWVEGHYKAAGIKKDFETRLEEAYKRQNKWFVNLVRIAEDDWARAHQHNAISDIQRYAAKAIGAKVEWLSITMDAMQIQCPLCKELVRNDAVVHSTCGYILKPEEYEAMQSRILPKGTREQLASIGVK